MTSKIKSGLYWHCHHDRLLEFCYDYQERVDYIMMYKPKSEIKTRLRLFKPVKKLSKSTIILIKKIAEQKKRTEKAHDKYIDFAVDYVMSPSPHQKILLAKKENLRKRYRIEDDKDNDLYFKLQDLLDNHPFWEKLHKKECNCKEWNGNEIVFSRSRKK